jgi:hypothetical protein
MCLDKLSDNISGLFHKLLLFLRTILLSVLNHTNYIYTILQSFDAQVGKTPGPKVPAFFRTLHVLSTQKYTEGAP